MNMYSQIKNRTRALCVTVLCGIICIITTPAAVRAASPEQTATAFISSDLYVGADNTISVTEVIEIHQVELLQSTVITRRFGTAVQDSLGNILKRHIVFHDVQVDGQTAEWTLTTLPDEILEMQIPTSQGGAATGVRTYVLSYTVDDGIIFNKQDDQLFWEVTSSQWDIPIPWSRVVVHTPETLPAKDIKIQLRTGTWEKADTAALFNANENILTGITNRTLAPGESFSVLLTLPKGHVAEPGWIAGVWWILRDNKNLILYLGTLVALFIYYWLAWFFFGRDPEPKTVVAQYEPPLGMSPAALAYILYMRSEKRGLAAALINLAKRGYITLTPHEFDYTMTRTGKHIDKTTPPEEMVLLLELFATTGTAPVSTADPSIIPKAHQGIADSLRIQFKKQYFRYNTLIVFIGMGASWAMLTLLDYYPIPSIAVWTWFLLLAAINIGFGLAMPTRTEAGKRLLEQIYGFRNFLKTTEEERLNFHHPPGSRTHQVDANLAYAVALGIPHTGTAELVQSLESVPPSELSPTNDEYMRSHLLFDSEWWRIDLGVMFKRLFRRLRGHRHTLEKLPDSPH